MPCIKISNLLLIILKLTSQVLYKLTRMILVSLPTATIRPVRQHEQAAVRHRAIGP